MRAVQLHRNVKSARAVPFCWFEPDFITFASHPSRLTVRRERLSEQGIQLHSQLFTTCLYKPATGRSLKPLHSSLHPHKRSFSNIEINVIIWSTIIRIYITQIPPFHTYMIVKAYNLWLIPDRTTGIRFSTESVNCLFTIKSTVAIFRPCFQ